MIKHGIALLLAIVFIALLALWIRGRWIGDCTWLTTQSWNGPQLLRRQLGVAMCQGQVVITADTMRARIDDDWTLWQWKKLYPDERRVRHARFGPKAWPGASFAKWLGIGWHREVLAKPTNDVTFRAASSFAIPTWMLVLGMGIWPVRSGSVALRRWRRRRAGLCLVCGYDLRESVERCPECGTARG
jgi:hypothetical protein